MKLKSMYTRIKKYTHTHVKNESMHGFVSIFNCIQLYTVPDFERELLRELFIIKKIFRIRST